MSLGDFKIHFDAGYCEGIQHYIKEVAMRLNRYIFMTKIVKGYYKGYCSYCKAEFRIPSVKHKEHYQCHGCEGTHQVRNTGYGRKTFIEEAYFTYFEKSQLNPSIIVARGIHVTWDFRYDYRNFEQRLTTKAYYIFEYGKKARALVNQYWNESHWIERKTIRELAHSVSSLGRVWAGVSRESVLDAVEETMFQYSEWEKYIAHTRDMSCIIDYFDLFAKHPCTEIFAKLGLYEVIDTKLTRIRGYGDLKAMFEWRSKEPHKVLKIPKHRFRELVKHRIRMDLYTLDTVKALEASGIKYSIQDVEEVSDFVRDESFTLNFMKSTFLEYMNLRKLYRYIHNQKIKDERVDLSVYRDYLRECKELAYDLTDKGVLFPSHLYRAHERTMALVIHNKDELLNMRINKRIAQLDVMVGDKYFIRPATSACELIEEGKTLSHCVGGYADDYSHGRCDIYLFRKIDYSDEPFVTVEIKQGKLIQARGLRNVTASEEVMEFINHFIKRINGDIAEVA